MHSAHCNNNYRAQPRRCERRLLWSDLWGKNCDEGGALYSCPLTSAPAPYNHEDRDGDDDDDDDDEHRNDDDDEHCYDDDENRNSDVLLMQ